MDLKKTTGINIGGSSILVIFIVLCLTTFSILSMVSARADLRLTEKSIAASAGFYAADLQAESIYAALDHAFRNHTEVTPEKWRTTVLTILPGATVDSDRTVRYIIPVNEGRQLEVALAVSEDLSCLVRSIWRVNNTGDWEPVQEGMELWDNETFPDLEQ